MRNLCLLCLIYFFSFQTILGQNKYSFETNLLGATINNPQGIATDNKGNVYVSEYNKIYKFSNSGPFITSFNRIASIAPKNLPQSHISKPQPNTSLGMYVTYDKLTVDEDGNIFILDNNELTLQKYDNTGKFIDKILLNLSTSEYVIDLDLDKQKNIWLLLNSGIRQYSPEGKLIKTINPINIRWGSLVFDKEDNFYVTVGFQIQKFNKNGELLFAFGEQGTNDGQFEAPFSMDLDEEGNIYVGEGSWFGDITRSSLIQKFSLSGKFLSKFGVKGSGLGQLLNPIDIALDKKGNLFILDDKINKGFKFIPTLNVISGTIFYDDNKNCVKDLDEKHLVGIPVVAQPGNLYGISDINGNFIIKTDTGNYSLSQILPPVIPNKVIAQLCPITSHQYIFKSYGDTIKEANFGNKVLICPFLQTNISSNRRRRCFLNSTTVSYSNSGFAKAENIKVYVKMPEYVVLKSANKTFTRDSEGNYVFTIGTLDVNQSGIINIQDSVVCKTGITGLTACTKVWITPSNNCTPPKSTWDKSDVVLSGKCIDNGFVRIVLRNIGEGNMADSTQLRIFLDTKLALKRGFKLSKGDSLVVRIPANGRTVRLEADQRPDHPRKSQSNITFEGCVASLAEVVSKGFVNQLPQDDTEPEVSIDCQRIIDSFDPNDKQVSPIGTTAEHFTPTNAELQYLIRFQNTGTDTAYTVTVIDTLSENLDIATLQIGASSHKYKLNISGKGKPVLTWTFNNINLPDSTRNEKASNGFLSFSIKPKENLPVKTKIENFTDIIFDFNDPVRTNTTFNTIYDVPLIIANEVKLEEKTIIPLPLITSFSPTKAKVGENITVKGKNFETLLQNNLLKIKDLQAVIQSANDSVIVFKVPQGAVSGKLSLKTSYGFAESLTDFMVLNPPVISSFSPETGIPNDKITISGSGFDIITTNNSVKFGEIQAEVVSASENQLVVKVPSGFYQAKISVTTPIGTSTSSKDFTMLLTPLEKLPENQISIYPNPTDGKITIEFRENAIKVLEIKVLNVMGSIIFEKKAEKPLEKIEIYLSGKSADIYLLLIKTESGVISKKVILK